MLLSEMVLGKDYNAAQLRDEAGRWSDVSGSGSSTGAVVMKPTTDYARTRAKEITRVVTNRGEFTSPSEEQVERVASLLSQHDEKVVRAVRGIHIASGSIAFAGEYKRAGAEGPSVGTVAFWDKKYDRITLRSNYDGETFHHEMGHAAWQNSFKRGIWIKPHREDPKFDRHTSYSKEDMDEAFSESYSAWVSSGGRASEPRYQRTFDAVSGVVNGIP